MKLLDGHVELVPLLFLCTDKHEHQIRANREIGCLIRDHHRVKIRLEALQTFVNHGNQVRADGIHLRMELAADHAIAQINQAGPGITLHLAASFFEALQNQDAGRLLHSFHCAGSKVEH